MGTRTSGFYRHDLDGLRGVAIALVAVFHVWFGRVSGGVDVFLVLSGFFFGGSLLRTALNPDSTLSPASEVLRLVRRLLPALVLVLAERAAQQQGKREDKCEERDVELALNGHRPHVLQRTNGFTGPQIVRRGG